MHTMERPERLKAVNADLDAADVKPIQFLGDRRRDEPEVTSVIGVDRSAAPLFTTIFFACLMPDGTEARYAIDSNGDGNLSDGATVIARINGKYLIVEQWRLGLSKWLYEFPRTFPKTDGMKMSPTNVANATQLIYPIPEEIEMALVLSTDKKVVEIGSPAENSGRSSNRPAVLVVDLRIHERELAAYLATPLSGKKLHLWAPSRLRSEIGGRINDNHSLAAWALLQARLA